MPIYEYRCETCRRRVERFFKNLADAASPTCTHCGGSSLTRLMSRVTVIKSWGSSLASPENLMDDIDENDPVAMQSWMRRIKEELGDESPELNEMDMLDAGVSPSDFHDHGEGEELF